MTLELPIFRLGLAGFSAGQQQAIASFLPAAAWELGPLDGADAWWINGERVQAMADQRVRVVPGDPCARSLQLHLPDIGRPVAFSTPLAIRDFLPPYSFDPSSRASMNAVLKKFDAWLAPVAAQFFLASHILEHESALGAGVFELHHNGSVLAVVDMRGDTGVSPAVGPADLEDAVWRRRSGPAGIPEGFVRASLAQLMWQCAVRTRRDVLPGHYRTGALYFRRTPRLPQRLLTDTHLLLMRELAARPATFEVLQKRCGLDKEALAHALAALYFVGTITSNPKRAANPPRFQLRRADDPEPAPGPQSALPSGLDSVPCLDTASDAPVHDFTAPAPLGPH